MSRRTYDLSDSNQYSCLRDRLLFCRRQRRILPAPSTVDEQVCDSRQLDRLLSIKERQPPNYGGQSHNVVLWRPRVCFRKLAVLLRRHGQISGQLGWRIFARRRAAASERRNSRTDSCASASFYTPVATFGSDYLLEPVAYGLKFAGSFSGGTLLKAELSKKLQAAGVNATAYAAKLPGGQTSVIILNKDAVANLELELDFGRGKSGAVETETLHAQALDSREAHITAATKAYSLKQGKCSVVVPHATGLRLTVV